MSCGCIQELGSSSGSLTVVFEVSSRLGGVCQQLFDVAGELSQLDPESTLIGVVGYFGFTGWACRPGGVMPGLGLADARGLCAALIRCPMSCCHPGPPELSVCSALSSS